MMKNAVVNMNVERYLFCVLGTPAITFRLSQKGALLQELEELLTKDIGRCCCFWFFDIWKLFVGFNGSINDCIILDLYV